MNQVQVLRFLRNRYAAIIIALLITLLMTIVSPNGAAAQETYVVRYGDTLSRIAQSYGLTVQQLVALNGIADPDLIIAGEVLTLDASSGQVTPMAAESVGGAPSQGGPGAEETTAVEPAAVPPHFEQAVIRDLLIDAAHRYGWDPTLIMAQAWQESRWRQDVVSWVGAIGTMQVMPDTSAELADWYFGYELDTWNSAYDNIDAGVAYLTMLYEVTGSIELALASYYQGWASVQTDGFFPDTEDYLDNVFRFQTMFMNGELPS